MQQQQLDITEVRYGMDNVITTVLEFAANATDRIDACVDHTRPSLAIEIESLRKAFLQAKKKGAKLRYITEINKNNIRYCKKLVNIVDEVRHLAGINGNFYINDREYIAPARIHKKGKPASQIIYSNLKQIIEHQRYVFETFWKYGTDGRERIKQIEKGVELQDIEVIRTPLEIQKRAVALVKSASKEILIIFSTANAFHRQERSGAMNLLSNATLRGVDVKILTPFDNRIEKKQKSYKRKSGSMIEIVKISGEEFSPYKSTLLMVDKKFTLAVELRDDTKKNSAEAIGLAIYSNSKPTVLSYVSMFNILWTQSELYEKLAQANTKLAQAIEQLESKDKIQKEFINIAAHELRSPIQPVLGLCQVLRSTVTDEKQIELLDVISRNSKRLQRLAEDILDVTRIESRTLNLKKERFNLNVLIANCVQDRRIQFEKERQKVKLEYGPSKEDIIIHGDKARLTQVILNLLDNSFRFTKGGIVIVKAKLKNNFEATVTVKDTGMGIDSILLPRLFTKFASKPELGGTGLGLFIARSIIEAHGGKIWARNNTRVKGATFSFCIPLE